MTLRNIPKANIELFNFPLSEDDEKLFQMRCSGIMLKCSFCNSQTSDVGIYSSSLMENDDVSSCNNPRCTELRKRAINIKQAKKPRIRLCCPYDSNLRVSRSSGDIEDEFSAVEVGYSCTAQKYTILTLSCQTTKNVYIDECATLNEGITLQIRYNPFVSDQMIEELNKFAGREFLTMTPVDIR